MRVKASGKLDPNQLTIFSLVERASKFSVGANKVQVKVISCNRPCMRRVRIRSFRHYRTMLT